MSNLARHEFKEMQERRQYSRSIVSEVKPSKQSLRDEIARDTAAWEAAGGQKEVIPTAEPRPYLESTRRKLPDDETYKRQVFRKPTKAKTADAGKGELIGLPEVAVMCCLGRDTLTKMISDLVGPPVAEEKRAGGRVIRSFYREEVERWNEERRTRTRGSKATLVVRDYRSPIPNGMLSTNEAAEFIGLSRTVFQRRIDLGLCPHYAFDVQRGMKISKGWELSDLLRWSARFGVAK